MGTHITKTDMQAITDWLYTQAQTHDYGEAHICLKIHSGKAALLEKSFTEKIQLSSGGTGQHEYNRR